jgi:hypothetical protein
MTVTDFNKSDKSPPPFGTSFPIDSTGAAHSVSIPQCIYRLGIIEGRYCVALLFLVLPALDYI